MIIIRIGYLLVLMLLVSIAHGQDQSNSNGNLTHDSLDDKKFSMLLDTVTKYMYRDLDLTNEALDECHLMLEAGLSIRDSVLMKYALSQIYTRYVERKPVDAYQVILDNQYLVTSNDVSSKQLGDLKYLESFTYLYIGDLEAAQKALYEGLELGREQKDTSAIIKNLGSLVQLYSREDDYEQALKYCEEAIGYFGVFDMSKSTQALMYFEKAAIYQFLEDYDEAKEQYKFLLNFVCNHQLDYHLPDIYSQLGQMLIEMNEIDSAEYVYKKMVDLDFAEDEAFLRSSGVLNGKILKAQKRFPEAEKVFVGLLEKTDTTELESKMNDYYDLSFISEMMNDHESAYTYLSEYNKFKEKKEGGDEQQKTSYLKVKYASDKKEKDNAILQAALYKSKAEKNQLYGWIILAFLAAVAFLFAFYQKLRYSRHLEDTVKKRTENLQQSNEELEELNRILSHELKEPVRSIVSFSDLITRDGIVSSKKEEYLNIINRSGKQLDQLLDDVSFLRESKSAVKKWTSFNVNSMLTEITEDLSKIYQNKEIHLYCDDSLNIEGPTKSLKHVFKALFDNSSKYNDNHSVEIRVQYKLQKNTHSFMITDNGLGIDSKFQVQVFNLFERLHTKAEYDGSGLGLGMVKRILTDIQGKISMVESKLGEGTTFNVSFPGRR